MSRKRDTDSIGREKLCFHLSDDPCTTWNSVTLSSWKKETPFQSPAFGASAVGCCRGCSFQLSPNHVHLNGILVCNCFLSPTKCLCIVPKEFLFKCPQSNVTDGFPAGTLINLPSTNINHMRAAYKNVCRRACWNLHSQLSNFKVLLGSIALEGPECSPNQSIELLKSTHTLVHTSGQYVFVSGNNKDVHKKVSSCRVESVPLAKILVIVDIRVR